MDIGDELVDPALKHHVRHDIYYLRVSMMHKRTDELLADTALLYHIDK